MIFESYIFEKLSMNSTVCIFNYWNENNIFMKLLRSLACQLITAPQIINFSDLSSNCSEIIWFCTAVLIVHSKYFKQRAINISKPITTVLSKSGNYILI